MERGIAGTAPRSISPTFGEVVFTTNLTGYQETFTDPSYLGQIVVMTAPMIGNYGVNFEDMESRRPQVSGVVCRELSRNYSSWRAETGLGEWLAESSVPLIEGVDTRRLTRHIRERGAMRGVIAEGTEPTRELTRAAAGVPVDGGARPRLQGDGRGHARRGRGPARGGLRLRDEAEHRPDAGRPGAARSRWCRPRRRPTRSGR